MQNLDINQLTHQAMAMDAQIRWQTLPWAWFWELMYVLPLILLGILGFWLLSLTLRNIESELRQIRFALEGIEQSATSPNPFAKQTQATDDSRFKPKN